MASRHRMVSTAWQEPVALTRLEPSYIDPIEDQHVGFTPAPSFPPFKFEPKRSRIDWRLLHGVDLNSVVRDVDIETLERVVSVVAFGDIDAEDVRNLTEYNFIKVFRLAQLVIEYLLYVQECLQASNSWLQHDRKNQEKYTVSLRSRARELDSQLKLFKRELRRTRKTVKTYEILAQFNNSAPPNQTSDSDDPKFSSLRTNFRNGGGLGAKGGKGEGGGRGGGRNDKREKGEKEDNRSISSSGKKKGRKSSKNNISSALVVHRSADKPAMYSDDEKEEGDEDEAEEDEEEEEEEEEDEEEEEEEEKRKQSKKAKKGKEMKGNKDQKKASSEKSKKGRSSPPPSLSAPDLSAPSPALTATLDLLVRQEVDDLRIRVDAAAEEFATLHSERTQILSFLKEIDSLMQISEMSGRGPGIHDELLIDSGGGGLSHGGYGFAGGDRMRGEDVR
eukprot:CAMPEP_0175055438 /NCGR_PEP_ID=MMETSP0052_2-20121109/10079_1 /TAXON_ID=51329 ORGANISM="Polytomella parva, Strain SAG 63-3" /NCGR_SAMPLE_ID=MMETSP0052_2 /ASSEMBLY_ACC=CAM_ASM_000194 /LENGTH=446 /DNA_ID=CAMNT_0016320281 /DNA_START=21 /DNA_END=1358 /DNA_ORIENTATION=+